MPLVDSWGPPFLFKENRKARHALSKKQQSSPGFSPYEHIGFLSFANFAYHVGLSKFFSKSGRLR